ncbi:hypothetical protein OIB37_03960 [Streptomyces sp. NBC_00820]|uniref:hypothetical protein n=1 Tax=Streptomyces sp. NBC_00820 TaxID=2975842 RepID=UPI002ED04C38|nr:hypothetical protein OIB37_03960 [Streptomyces sp. NBC_00820]
MTRKDHGTGKRDASEAARILADPNSTPEERSVAASDLSEAGVGKHTSKRVASEAGQLLDDPDISEDDRSVAGSDLSQARKRKH